MAGSHLPQYFLEGPVSSRVPPQQEPRTALSSLCQALRTEYGKDVLGESSHIFPLHMGWFIPHSYSTGEVFRRRDVHEICILTFTLGNLSRHCPQQHLISETLKSHPIQMQIKSFLTITVE